MSLLELSEILNEEDSFSEDVQVDLEPILQEEYIDIPTSVDDTCREETSVLDVSDLMVPIKMHPMMINATKFSVNKHQLVAYYNDTLSWYSQKSLIGKATMKKVSCLFAYEDQMVVGFEDGLILLMQGSHEVCRITEHKSQIICLAMESHIVSSDIDGNVFLSKISNTIFSKRVESQTVIQKQFYIQIKRAEPITQMLLSGNYLTLANQLLVVTACIQPMKIVNIFQKPRAHVDLSMGTVTVDDRLQQVLSIQWNCCIQLIQNDWMVSYFNGQDQMHSAKFVSVDIMIAHHSEGFLVLHAKSFTPGRYTIKSDQRPVIYRYAYDQQIHSIKALNNHVYFIQDQRIFTLHLLNWLQYFKHFVAESQWDKGLKLLTAVYKGHMKALPDLDIDEDQKIIKSLSKNYIKTTLQNCFSSMQNCIEFALYCDMPELLAQIKESAILNNAVESYYQIVESNIPNMKTLPQEIFLDLAKHFNPESFQKLVVNLNLQSIDVGFTYEQCIKQQIFTPLIYLCPRKDNDFITPLNKMFEVGTNLLKEKCLWFIKITQKQILFPSETLELDIWKKAIRLQFQWLMISIEDFICDELYGILYRYLRDPCLSALDCPDILAQYSIDSISRLHQVVFDRMRQIQGQSLQYLLFVRKIIEQIQITDKDELFHLIFTYNKQYMDSYTSAPEDFDQILQIVHYLVPHNSLREEAREHQCADYLSYCLLSEGRISDAIRCFYEHDELHLRVYQWLELQEYDDRFLLEMDLLNQDPERCARLISKWPQDVIERLIITQPSKQILQVFKALTIPLTSFIRLKVIELMSVFEPNGVIPYLSGQSLDEVEQIFIRTNNITGLGYVNEQGGQYQKALQYYLQVYMDCSYDYLVYYKRRDELSQNFQNIMRTCKEDEHLYVELAKALFNQNVYRSHWSKLKRRHTLFNTQFSQLFNALFRFSNELISIIENNNEIFNCIHLKNSFIAVFQSFGYERQLLQKNKIVITNDNTQIFRTLFINLSQSRSYIPTCLECEKQLSTGDINPMLLKCGHCVHSECLQNKYCRKCSDTSVQIMLESIKDEESKQSKLKGQDCEMQVQDDVSLDSDSPLDQRVINEMRIMNKLSVFDSIHDTANRSMDQFIDYYY